jgi:GTP-sensing pleiotropic transcriptional regulator CodY
VDPISQPCPGLKSHSNGNRWATRRLAGRNTVFYDTDRLVVEFRAYSICEQISRTHQKEQEPESDANVHHEFPIFCNFGEIKPVSFMADVVNSNNSFRW